MAFSRAVVGHPDTYQILGAIRTVIALTLILTLKPEPYPNPNHNPNLYLLISLLNLPNRTNPNQYRTPPVCAQ